MHPLIFLCLSWFGLWLHPLRDFFFFAPRNTQRHLLSPCYPDIPRKTAKKADLQIPELPKLASQISPLLFRENLSIHLTQFPSSLQTRPLNTSHNLLYTLGDSEVLTLILAASHPATILYSSS